MMKYNDVAAACVERGLARCLGYANNTPAAVRRYKRSAGADRARLRGAAACDTLSGLSLRVAWNRSRTWGSCPRVSCDVFGAGCVGRSSGYASGCGYDKLSAACAEALDNSPAVLRCLVENFGRARSLRREWDRARAAAVAAGSSVSRFNFSPVLTVYRGMLDGDGLPAFGPLGGAGWSSVRCVLEWLGLRCVCEDRGAERSDYFSFERGGRLPSGLVRK